LPYDAHWSEEETDNPLLADDRNFYKVEKHLRQCAPPGRGKVLSPFPNGPVRRPNRTRHRGRIGIIFGRGRISIVFRGWPRQTRELATSANPDEVRAGSEGSSPFFVENVE
jgi:hypothetical protein